MLTATALTALLLLGITQLLRVTLLSASSILKTQQELSHEAFFETEIRRGVERSNAYHGIPGVKILTATELKRHIQNSDINLSRNLQPKAENEALSFLHLGLSAQLSVILKGEESSLLQGCFPQHRPLGDLWLAVNIDGYRAVRSELRVSGAALSCDPLLSFEGLLRPERRIPQAFFSVEAEQSRFPVPPRPAVLLPIDESYAIYLATNGDLRRLSFTTSESQPLLRGCESLFIITKKESGALNINAQLNCKQSGLVRVETSTRSVRAEAWMELLL